jgi:soluble lytic murein transglycosylase-like protein
MGLGQLMPGTASGLGVSNAYDPVQNIAGSVKLIRGHLNKITDNAAWTDTTWHDLSLALASYNAGPGAVRKYGGVPPYRETQNYIKKVISIYKELCGCK